MARVMAAARSVAVDVGETPFGATVAIAVVYGTLAMLLETLIAMGCVYLALR